jgi:CRISPR-associated protein Cas8b/Csh1 subtype I-B
LLYSFYKLGLTQNKGTDLADNPKVKLVIGIAFVKKKKKITYDSIRISEYKEESLYLYKRDLSGRPGLFLSGSVAQNDVKKIIDSLGKSTENQIIKDFVEKKIVWFPDGKLITNKMLSEFSNVSDDLEKIFVELISNKDKIGKDIISKIKESKPQKYLITIMPPKDNDSEFIGNIEDYVTIFNKGSLSKKTTNNQMMVCTVCNKSKIIESFTESPLPFYYSDKLTFFPDIDESQRNKGFPLCDECNIVIQKGWKYIKKSWDFGIPNLGKKSGSSIRFWLIPQLHNVEYIKKLESDRKKNLYYLNELKDLSTSLKRITEFDTGSKEVNLFLRFSSLFYSMDSNGHMRITDYIQGIFPEQLQKLLSVKKIIDEKFPYEKISTKIKNLDLSFGFPLLIYFFEGRSPQWQEQVIEILENLFTGKQTNKLLVLQVINCKIYESWKTQKPTVFFECLKGLILLEYLIRLENNQEPVSIMSKTALTPQIEQIEKFLSEHTEVLADNTSIATFGVGVCVGILLEIQTERYHKVAPFWSRLNRLDLDLDRIKEFFPQVKSYLAMYGEQDYDTIINYVGINLISKLDPFKQISTEQLNFVFSLGLSLGYLVKKDYLK